MPTKREYILNERLPVAGPGVSRSFFIYPGYTVQRVFCSVAVGGHIYNPGNLSIPASVALRTQAQWKTSGDGTEPRFLHDEFSSLSMGSLGPFDVSGPEIYLWTTSFYTWGHQSWSVPAPAKVLEPGGSVEVSIRLYQLGQLSLGDPDIHCQAVVGVVYQESAS